MTNTYITSKDTGREYWIDDKGLASPAADTEQDWELGCECELDWRCPHHAGLALPIDLINHRWAMDQTEMDRRGGWPD